MPPPEGCCQTVPVQSDVQVTYSIQNSLANSGYCPGVVHSRAHMRLNKNVFVPEVSGHGGMIRP
jgi:hypothetical protein